MAQTSGHGPDRRQPDDQQSGVCLVPNQQGQGAGGRYISEHGDPRGARVVALEKPSDSERGQWYFQRYVVHLPTASEMVLFDRS